MRARLVVAFVLLACSVESVGASPPAGRLVGATQITYGCPGPERVGGPPCEQWLVFPQARLAITRLTAAGKTVAGSRRLVVSDARGRFSLVLSVGRYRLSLLPQPHTRGGDAIRVTVKTRSTTWVRVRFQGFPQMA